MLFQDVSGRNLFHFQEHSFLYLNKIRNYSMFYKESFVEAYSFSMNASQVAVSTNKEVDGQIPNYPSLPPQLICQLHNVTMHVSRPEV